MTVIVIVAFAFHVLAWLFLPDGTLKHERAKETVPAARSMQASGA